MDKKFHAVCCSKLTDGNEALTVCALNSMEVNYGVITVNYSSFAANLITFFGEEHAMMKICGQPRFLTNMIGFCEWEEIKEELISQKEVIALTIPFVLCKDRFSHFSRVFALFKLAPEVISEVTYVLTYVHLWLIGDISNMQIAYESNLSEIQHRLSMELPNQPCTVDSPHTSFLSDDVENAVNTLFDKIVASN